MPAYKFKTDGSHLSKVANRRPASTGFGWHLFGENGYINRMAVKPIIPSSNNVAEWCAVIDAVEYTLTRLSPLVDVTEVLIETDSELVVKQISGEYAVKKENLKLLKARYEQLLNQADFPIVVKHIPREENQIADALSKIASLLND